MKVLHLHAGTLYGGVETFLVTLARERALCPEMEHHFGLCFEMRMTQELREQGIPVTMVGEARFSRPLTVLQTRSAFKKLAARFQPDVVICHMAKPYWLYGAAARKMGLPVVYYMHGPIHTMDLFDKLLKRGRQPDLMIGVSEHTVRVGKEMLFPDVPSAVINYPMPWPSSRYDFNAESKAALRTELDTPPGAVVVVQAVRMDPWKGHKDLLAALALLKDVPGWVHWLVGGAQKPHEIEYLEGLKQQVREAGIEDRVRFVGQRTDVPRFLASADVYSQANTESEGFSLSFTEAMSAGLPIVTTDIGSAGEVVTPDIGLLAPVHDAAKIADALKAILTDGPRRERMGAAAKARVHQLCETGQQIRRLHSELSRVAKGS
ncbi:MAG: glycosyltransferase [Cytophagales bacterium]|nr:glycosyltransferase [Armatimonadota bacterium]